MAWRMSYDPNVSLFDPPPPNTNNCVNVMYWLVHDSFFYHVSDFEYVLRGPGIYERLLHQLEIHNLVTTPDGVRYDSVELSDETMNDLMLNEPRHSGNWYRDWDHGYSWYEWRKRNDHKKWNAVEAMERNDFY